MFYQSKTKSFLLGDKEDSLGLLNDFLSRKTINLLETLVEYQFFFHSGFFLIFSFVWRGSRES